MLMQFLYFFSCPPYILDRKALYCFIVSYFVCHNGFLVKLSPPSFVLLILINNVHGTIYCVSHIYSYPLVVIYSFSSRILSLIMVYYHIGCLFLFFLYTLDLVVPLPLPPIFLCPIFHSFPVPPSSYFSCHFHQH